MYKYLFFKLVFFLLLFSGCVSKNVDIKSIEKLYSSHPQEEKKIPIIPPNTTHSINKTMPSEITNNKNEYVSRDNPSHSKKQKSEPSKKKKFIIPSEKNPLINKPLEIQKKHKIIRLKKESTSVYKSKIHLEKPVVKVQRVQKITLPKKIPEVNVKTKENIDLPSNHIKVGDKKSQNKESSEIKKQNKRVQEIMSQINGVRESKEEASVFLEKKEEQKKIRIEELISQMNTKSDSMKKIIPKVVLESKSREKEQKKSRVEELINQMSTSNKELSTQLEKKQNISKKSVEVIPFVEKKIVQKKTSKDLESLPKIQIIRKKSEIKEKEEELYRVRKVVGDKVCRDARGLLSFVCMDFIASVEEVKADKIKVKILDSQCQNTAYNGIGLYKNTIIWDEYYNWKLCN